MGFKPRQRRVCVHWNDAMHEQGWKWPPDPHAFPNRIVTTGYVLRKTAKTIEVAQSVAEAGSVGDVLSIPLGCVIRIERL